ncbi:cytochrome c family protein [Novosphingobium sp. 1949]|uniref:Cytochrome c family protein n=1 Tax=Novosphingobium organovorum TaxID=2930092 RepID=A0ABT0B9D6_9SPHN|nr:cytochrome c family protein [Novosphingobium organovorum]MCJ2181409.1 cytochrome c family protein [Novosphingobium organovorum]
MRKMHAISSLSFAAAMTVALMPSVASADAARGKTLFTRCMACHTVEKGGANRIGPNLSGVVGRKSGTEKGFKYSAAMSKAKLTWTEANLDKWLTKPAALVPGTSMAFAGLPKAEDRQSLIDYLKNPGK